VIPKMFNIAPDPVAKTEVGRLLEYARRVVQTELVVVGEEHPGRDPAHGGRDARKGCAPRH
jgi:hypothetical protein